MTTETAHFYGPVNMHGNALSNAGGVPTYRSDVYANRGAAAAHVSEYFFATDDPLPGIGTLYYSDGATWTMIASPKGELGRTTLTSASSTTSGTAATAITSFTLALTSFATARSVQLRLHGPVQNTAADELDATVCGYGTITGVSTTIASPGVINKTGHGLVAGMQGQFASLPNTTGISVNTNYFVLAAGLTANSFQIGATAGGAAINFGGTTDTNLTMNVGAGSTYSAGALTVLCKQTLPAAAMTANVDNRIDVSAPIDLPALPVGVWNFLVKLQCPNTGTGKFSSSTGGAGSGSFYAYLQALLL